MANTRPGILILPSENVDQRSVGGLVFTDRLDAYRAAGREVNTTLPLGALGAGIDAHLSGHHGELSNAGRFFYVKLIDPTRRSQIVTGDYVADLNLRKPGSGSPLYSEDREINERLPTLDPAEFLPPLTAEDPSHTLLWVAGSGTRTQADQIVLPEKGIWELRAEPKPGYSIVPETGSIFDFNGVPIQNTDNLKEAVESWERRLGRIYPGQNIKELAQRSVIKTRIHRFTKGGLVTISRDVEGYLRLDIGHPLITPGAEQFSGEIVYKQHLGAQDEIKFE